nr:unnamed protein product [Callosobruchus analis]
MSTYNASKEFDVFKASIIDRMKGGSRPDRRKAGPAPIPITEVEDKIKEWIIDIAKCEFPLKKSDLMDTVEKIAKDIEKAHLFTNGKSGQKWLLNFMKHHPEISKREAKGVNRARAPKENIKKIEEEIKKSKEEELKLKEEKELSKKKTEKSREKSIKKGKE